jgi:Na+-driven multidrug efflux pump
MYATWLIALIVSGGAAGWLYGKMLKNNGNQRDTMIASVVLWVVGFFFLFILLRSVGV